MKRTILLIILLVAVSVKHLTNQYEIPFLIMMFYVVVNSFMNLNESKK